MGAIEQQASTQFIGITVTGGSLRANGAAFFSGFIDYLNLVNERDGGINGVKLSWEDARPSTTTQGCVGECSSA
jgi:branched-chain amino acid transport system substrate-binding protein